MKYIIIYNTIHKKSKSSLQLSHFYLKIVVFLKIRNEFVIILSFKIKTNIWLIFKINLENNRFEINFPLQK